MYVCDCVCSYVHMYACFCGCEKVDSLSLFPILPYKWTTILERIIAINFLQFSLQKVPCNRIPYKAVPISILVIKVQS